MPLGQRQVVDLAAELSLHLVEPVFNQVLASPIGPGSGLTITLEPDSPLPATYYLYPGALIVVGWHADDAEVVEVIAVTGDNTFTGNLVNAHAAGESVFGATFPTQEPTDPVFTQAEIQGYIAQAQNEFLTKVPLIFEFFPNQLALLGQSFQTVPDKAIEMERVALTNAAVSFPIETIERSGGTVTAVLPTSANADKWTPGLPVVVMGVGNNSFNSVSNSTFDLATVSPDGLTLTWPQSATDASSTGGIVSRQIWTRLYESSQSQIAMQNPFWFSDQGTPKKFFEDRTGIYGWGLAPVPDAGYYVELLTSIRGSEALGLLDSLEVPDIFAYLIKWKALEFCWTKNGIQRSPSMAKWASARFDFGVMLAQRFLRNVVEQTAKSGV